MITTLDFRFSWAHPSILFHFLSTFQVWFLSTFHEPIFINIKTKNVWKILLCVMICKMHLYNLIKLNILCSPVIFFFFYFIWKISGICENSYCFRHKNPSSFIEQIICKYDLYLHSVVDVGWMSIQWFIVHLDLFVRKPACDLIHICLTHTCLYFPFCSMWELDIIM